MLLRPVVVIIVNTIGYFIRSTGRMRSLTLRRARGYSRGGKLTYNLIFTSVLFLMNYLMAFPWHLPLLGSCLCVWVMPGMAGMAGMADKALHLVSHFALRCLNQRASSMSGLLFPTPFRSPPLFFVGW